MVQTPVFLRIMQYDQILYAFSLFLEHSNVKDGIAVNNIIKSKQKIPPFVSKVVVNTLYLCK